jgi:hypothetical protein
MVVRGLSLPAMGTKPPRCVRGGQPRRLSPHERSSSEYLVGCLRQHLEVLEPPVGSPGFERCEPAAGEIEQHDGDRPDQVEKWKTPDIAIRRLGIAHWVVGEEPRADEAEADLRHD